MCERLICRRRNHSPRHGSIMKQSFPYNFTILRHTHNIHLVMSLHMNIKTFFKLIIKSPNDSFASDLINEQLYMVLVDNFHSSNITLVASFLSVRSRCNLFLHGLQSAYQENIHSFLPLNVLHINSIKYLFENLKTRCAT